MPDWRRVVRERLTPLGLDPTGDAELAEELANHLEDRYRELKRSGAEDEAAYHETVHELDDIGPLQADLKRNRHITGREPVTIGARTPGSFLDDSWRDLRYAIRTLRKSPLFVLVVVLILALGVGANTTVFTVINTLILNPLAVPTPSQLAAVATLEGDKPSASAALLLMSYPDLIDYRGGNDVFESLAGYSGPRIVICEIGRSPERMFAELVTGNYFSTLGLGPSAGRFFTPAEDGPPGAPALVVLNYNTWQTRFGGAAIIGTTLTINHISFTVVGVAPPRFIGVNAVFGPDMWIPAAMAERLLPTDMKGALSDRNKAAFRGVGRLKPELTISRAQAGLSVIASALAREYPDTNEGHSAAVRPIRDAMFASANSGSSPILFASAILMAVVGIVLLIACSNVANLLLSRSAARRQEMAVRLAIGAKRQTLVRQLLTESLCLALLGGAAGLLVGYLGLELLFSSLPGSANFVVPKFDTTVFAFALGISLVTGLVFGAMPAIKTSRVNVADALKEEARTTGRSRSRVNLTNALLVGQVAFSFLLLVLAALVVRSIQQAYDFDPGFEVAHLAVFMTNPGQAGYSTQQSKEYYDAVRGRVASLPGIRSVSWASNLPLWARTETGLEVEGHEPRSRADRVTTVLTIVDLDYFETSGVAIERGREFTNEDRDRSIPVAIVNEKMARDYWPDGDAVGKRIRLPDEKEMRQIVGIARVANYSTWGEAPQHCVYVPLTQVASDAMTLYVRSSADPELVMTQVEHEMNAASPQVSVGGSRTGRQIVDGGLFQAKVGVMLLSIFGALALGLASVGLCGILAYSVSQRTREIGLRMALGATEARVRGLVLREGMSLVAAGMLIGAVPALLAGRLLKSLLYGVGTSDPLSVGVAIVMLSMVGLIACYLPARWATRVDPLVALRQA
ncbi:MAG TPA: ABC transporter permease [Vicinamibacterales bacterium]|nr:ABC transporter permease [Vicinamibacterales bacterium]